ncbi:Hsp70 family protein [Nocardia sp. NPDC051030]|uniref:Hsp70 family protein n=1 Tax=Nocardia sp. NPDC051030 TaxID=3155162 RepID=UPI00343C0406
MSQGMALGITVGSSNTVAVTTSGGQRKLHIRPSMLGSEQEVPESFLSRVGDPVDIRTRDGSAVRAADLVAAAVGRALDAALHSQVSHPAAAMVACYPAWWSQHTVEVQRAALAAAGLDGVALVPEPTAAMRWLQEVHESTHDGAMVVYDLGATGLTVSVARTGAMSGMLGEPVRSTGVAGAEFDLLTMRYVLAFAVGEKDFDPFDPLVEQELAALRVRCRIAKETLSKQTATMVPVRLPALGAVEVRLVRDELEDLFRGPLLTSTDLVREAIRRAGLTPADLDGILLTGGGAAIPLVTELLSTEFGVPVAAASDPAHLSAHGAALLAADLLADTTATEPHPAVTKSPAQRIVTGDAAREDSADAVAVDAPPETVTDDSVAAAGIPILPALPTSTGGNGFAHWRRVAVIGAAAIAVAALATGTLAMGTGMQSAPSDSTAPQPPSTSVAALDGRDGSANPTQQAAPIAQTVNTTAPTNPGALTHPGAPAAAAVATTADGPAPVAPAADPAASAGEANPPAPQPSTVQQQVPTVPQQNLPAAPTLPNLNDTLGSAAQQVPTVPNQILPRTGG